MPACAATALAQPLEEVLLYRLANQVHYHPSEEGFRE